MSLSKVRRVPFSSVSLFQACPVEGGLAEQCMMMASVATILLTRVISCRSTRGTFRDPPSSQCTVVSSFKNPWYQGFLNDDKIQMTPAPNSNFDEMACQTRVRDNFVWTRPPGLQTQPACVHPEQDGIEDWETEESGGVFGHSIGPSCTVSEIWQESRLEVVPQTRDTQESKHEDMCTNTNSGMDESCADIISPAHDADWSPLPPPPLHHLDRILGRTLASRTGALFDTNSTPCPKMIPPQRCPLPTTVGAGHSGDSNHKHEQWERDKHEPWERDKEGGDSLPAKLWCHREWAGAHRSEATGANRCEGAREDSCDLIRRAAAQQLLTATLSLSPASSSSAISPSARHGDRGGKSGDSEGQSAACYRRQLEWRRGETVTASLNVRAAYSNVPGGEWVHSDSAWGWEDREWKLADITEEQTSRMSESWSSGASVCGASTLAYNPPLLSATSVSRGCGGEISGEEKRRTDASDEEKPGGVGRGDTCRTIELGFQVGQSSVLATNLFTSACPLQSATSGDEGCSVWPASAQDSSGNAPAALSVHLLHEAGGGEQGERNKERRGEEQQGRDELQRVQQVGRTDEETRAWWQLKCKGSLYKLPASCTPLAPLSFSNSPPSTTAHTTPDPRAVDAHTTCADHYPATAATHPELTGTHAPFLARSNIVDEYTKCVAQPRMQSVCGSERVLTHALAPITAAVPSGRGCGLASTSSSSKPEYGVGEREEKAAKHGQAQSTGSQRCVSQTQSSHATRRCKGEARFLASPTKVLPSFERPPSDRQQMLAEASAQIELAASLATIHRKKEAHLRLQDSMREGYENYGGAMESAMQEGGESKQDVWEDADESVESQLQELLLSINLASAADQEEEVGGVGGRGGGMGGRAMQREEGDEFDSVSKGLYEMQMRHGQQVEVLQQYLLHHTLSHALPSPKAQLEQHYSQHTQHTQRTQHTQHTQTNEIKAERDEEEEHWHQGMGGREEKAIQMREEVADGLCAAVRSFTAKSPVYRIERAKRRGPLAETPQRLVVLERGEQERCERQEESEEESDVPYSARVRQRVCAHERKRAHGSDTADTVTPLQTPPQHLADRTCQMRTSAAGKYLGEAQWGSSQGPVQDMLATPLYTREPAGW